MSTYSQTLEDKVRDYLRTKYNREYTGHLTYTILPDTDGGLHNYKLSWGLNQETYPFIMQGQFVDEDHFLAYILKQIAITRFYNTQRFIAKRVGQAKFIDPNFIDPLLTFDKAHINT
jgi:hypothetical protein